MVEYGHFIGGKRVAGTSGRSQDVMQPMDGSVIVRQVQSLKRGEGYDAARSRYGNMFEFGIIDPAKVTKAALDNAVSIAGMVLTTNCLVTDLREEDKAPAPASMY